MGYGFTDFANRISTFSDFLLDVDNCGQVVNCHTSHKCGKQEYDKTVVFLDCQREPCLDNWCY